MTNHLTLRIYVEEREMKLDAQQLALRLFRLNAIDPDDPEFQAACEQWQDRIDAERIELRIFKLEMARRN